MIIDKYTEVKVSPTNRKKYEKILERELKNGEFIVVNQLDILSGSRTKIECECDHCGERFYRIRSYIKGDTTLCGRKCRNEILKISNPNPIKEKVDVKCCICEIEFQVFPSKFKKQENFLCSRECYSLHRSQRYSGERTYNYQDTHVNCETCGTSIKTSKWYMENKKHLFCSQECYWEHRRTFYTEFYYQRRLNDSRKETKPEKEVREWLENKDIKNKPECGFLRKYFVDFYLPDHKIIIEVYGDYWHVNPDVYDIDMNDKNKIPLNDYQENLVKSQYDALRKYELESHGYPVHILWEKDVMSDVNKAIRENKELSDALKL